MRIEINRLTDFYELAYPAYHRLKQDSGDEPALLELAFAPGSYTGTALNLSSDGGRVRLALRASDPTNPPVFSDLSLHLSSDAIEFENLIFRDSVSDVALLDLRVRSALAVRNCAFIANGSSANPGGELFSFAAAAPQATAEIRDCWFIRNRTLHQNPLLALNSSPPGFFADVYFDHVAFLENAAEAVIVPYAAQTLNIANCALSPAAAPARSIFVAINTTHSALTVDRSFLIGQSLPILVTRWSSTETSLDAFQPIRFTHTILFVEQDDPMPENSFLEETVIQSASLLNSGALEQGVDRAVHEAEAGFPPDIDQLYALLTTTT